MTVGSDQPFGEVPRNVVVADWRPRDVRSVGDQTHGCRTSRLKESEDWILVLSIDFEFSRKWEVGHEPITRSHILQAVHQLKVFCWFLVTELVTRETEELQMAMWFVRMIGLGVVRTILLLQFIHLAVLRGVTSEGCYVDGEENSSLIIFKVEHVVGKSVHFKLVEHIGVVCV